MMGECPYKTKRPEPFLSTRYGTKAVTKAFCVASPKEDVLISQGLRKGIDGFSKVSLLLFSAWSRMQGQYLEKWSGMSR